MWGQGLKGFHWPSCPCHSRLIPRLVVLSLLGSPLSPHRELLNVRPSYSVLRPSFFSASSWNKKLWAGDEGLQMVSHCSLYLLQVEWCSLLGLCQCCGVLSRGRRLACTVPFSPPSGSSCNILGWVRHFYSF